MITKCPNCGKKPHEQDKLHGPGNRVFNAHEHKDVCTVCGFTIVKSVGPKGKGKDKPA